MPRRSSSRLLVSTAHVATSVVAVVVLMVLPGRLAGVATGAPVPPAPSPTEQAEPIGGTGWTAQRCPGGAVGCEAPTVIEVDGARLTRTESHRQTVRRGDASTRTLIGRVAASEWGGRWVLVGAVGSSSASQLSVAFDDTEAAPIPAGALTLLPVPGRGEVTVTVSDYGRVGGREVLHIEAYAGR